MAPVDRSGEDSDESYHWWSNSSGDDSDAPETAHQPWWLDSDEASIGAEDSDDSYHWWSDDGLDAADEEKPRHRIRKRRPVATPMQVLASVHSM